MTLRSVGELWGEHRRTMAQGAELLSTRGGGGGGDKGDLLFVLTQLRPLLLQTTPSALAAMAVVACASFGVPYAQSRLMDAAMGESQDEQQAALLLLGLCMGLAQALTAFDHFVFHSTTDPIRGQLQRSFLRHVVTLDSAFFLATPSSDLVSRLNEDTTTLAFVAVSTQRRAFRCVLKIAGGLASMAMLHGSLVRLALLAALLWGVVNAARSRVVKAYGAVRAQAKRRADATASEVLSSMRTVRDHGADASECARFCALADREDAAMAQLLPVDTGLKLLSKAVVAAVDWAVRGGALLAVADGSLTIGGFTAFVRFFDHMKSGLELLDTLCVDLSQAAGKTAQYFDVMTRQRPTMLPDDSPEYLTPATRPLGRIAFRDVSFSYATRGPALQRVSLEVRPGATLALVGSSGAGKSTLASLLQRHFDPSDGCVELDGQDLRRLRPSWLRAQIGVVAQDSVLFNRTVRDNIGFGMDPPPSLAAVRAAARVADIDEFVSALPQGYDTVLGERGVTLSGGQRQRICIARAVAREPPVLLLDEATSALDSETEAHVQRALSRARRGRSTLVIAHRLATIRDADEIVVMAGGRVVERGDHAGLLRVGGAYAELVARQSLSIPPASPGPPLRS